MPVQYVTWELEDLVISEPLPGTVYLYIDFRFITFRAEGDVVDRNAFDRLQLKKLRQVFVDEKDRAAFLAWKNASTPSSVPPATSGDRELVVVRDEVRRQMLDIFLSTNPNKRATEGLSSSKKVVSQLMKTPLATRSLGQLQTFSRGTVDHSVNVGVLSVYLAMNMGYSHALLLQHIGAGALLHDFGKASIPIGDLDSDEEMIEKLKLHPTVGASLLEEQSKLASEVKMIIAQHHECHDGTGFPKGLKGNQIYELARIVAIANTFDELVTTGRGTLAERQAAAVRALGGELAHRFDPQKLDKALKILKLGL